MIPEKYKNTCPLDHSTYEKYIECNCNFGSANEVWYFKEQELAKLKRELKEAVEVIHWYAMPSINHHAYHDIMGTNLNIKAEQFLAKYRGINEFR